MQQTNANLAADIIKGAVAGTAAVWFMDQVGQFLYQREDPRTIRQEVKARVDNMDVAHVAANRLAKMFGKKLSPKEPHPAGIVLHYALGAIPGALYGPLRKRVPALRAGKGVVYGLALTAVNDELVAPLLGLASGPTAYPWQAHARGLISHVTLGVATEVGLDAMDRLT